jgi:hypothetical protein
MLWQFRSKLTCDASRLGRSRHRMVSAVIGGPVAPPRGREGLILTHIVTSPLSIAALRNDHLITPSAIAWLREKLQSLAV